MASGGSTDSSLVLLTSVDFVDFRSDIGHLNQYFLFELNGITRLGHSEWRIVTARYI
jgi:hypothetical protein